MLPFIISQLIFLLLLISGTSLVTYGQSPEDIFEKEKKEEKIDFHTTFFITPNRLKYNHRVYQHLDRSVTKIDRFKKTEELDYGLQDLGNHKTAAQHIVYTFPTYIGTTYGLSAYDFYLNKPEQIRYYVTHKTYTYFNIILANLASFMFDSCCTYRLFENWHIGINIRNSMTEKEWPPEKDLKIVSIFPDFDLFTHFGSKDGSYHCFTSFSKTKLLAREMGGVRSVKKDSKFDFSNHNARDRYKSSFQLLEEPYMRNTLSHSDLKHKQVRQNLYLYHQYEFDEQLQVYHELLKSKRTNSLTITHNDELLKFIAETSHDSEPGNRKPNIAMHILSNEWGLKGDSNLMPIFYSVYYRLEHMDLSYNFSQSKKIDIKDPWVKKLIDKKTTYLDRNTSENGTKHMYEHYTGLSTRLDISEIGNQKIYLDGEYLLSELTKNYHFVVGSYRNRFMKLGYKSIKHKVPNIINHGYSNYRKWNKAFVPPSAQAVCLELYGRLPYVSAHPRLSFTRINNHIFYTKKPSSTPDHCISTPIQANDAADILSYGGDVNFSIFGCFHLDNSITFFNDISNTPNKIFKGYMPQYLYTGRYYYAHQPYNKRMHIETGINIHFKALYYADGYDIVAQQFYRQNEFAVEGRPILDLFLNCRINNIKFFIKYSYINESFHKPKAYFTTPFYPGLKKAADIGINWSFFD